MSPHSRTRALLCALASLAIALAGLGCGGDDGGGDSREAKALLEKAFSTPVRSGELRIDLKADLDGGGKRLEEPLTLEVEGPFQWGGRKRLPLVDWDVSFNGAGADVKGGLVATADNGFLELQGQAYQLGTEAFASLARQYAALDTGGRPRSLGAFGVDPTAWLKDAELEGDGESIGGDDTRKIKGTVDVRKAAKDIAGLTRSPRLRRELERRGRPAPALPKPTDEDLDEIDEAVEEFDVEVNVDENDVVRKFAADFDFDLPGDQGDDLKGGRIELTYVLEKVNTKPVIRAPQNARPLGELLDGFGLGSLGGGLGGR